MTSFSTRPTRADLERVLRLSESDLASIGYYADHYLFPFDIAGKRILEIGGGSGSIALYLAVERGATVDVLDEYEGQGSAADNYVTLGKRLEALGFDSEVFKADVRSAKLPAETYDHAFARNAFHHIYSRQDDDSGPVSTFSRIRGWLKKGATLALGEASWVSAIRMIPPLRKRVFKDFQFGSKSTANRWTRCARLGGYENEGVAWYVPYSLRCLQPFLANRLANAFLTTAYVARFRNPKISS